MSLLSGLVDGQAREVQLDLIPRTEAGNLSTPSPEDTAECHSGVGKGIDVQQDGAAAIYCTRRKVGLVLAQVPYPVRCIYYVDTRLRDIVLGPPRLNADFAHKITD